MSGPNIITSRFIFTHTNIKDTKLPQTFNSSFRYVHDILSLNNSRFGYYLHIIYQNEIVLKRDDFTIPVVNFPLISSNMQTSPAYGVYISQILRYSMACAQYSNCRGRSKLIKQGYVASRLKSSLQKLYGRHHELVDHYEISISPMTMNLFLLT